ncbi:MAG TPA: Crp/Fnr family transcriptional regulator [Vicinamibacterales bacterium]|nr:Crp/Fnr family transcriptional regulator [Vicinamibacterales bacterium]
MEWAGRPALDAEAFFDSVGMTRRTVTYAPEAVVFAQGDASDRVLYLQEGEVRLSVRSQAGREALVATLGPGHFFGEACLAGERTRLGRATATRRSRILVIDKREMARRLREEPALSDWFIAHILTRNIAMEGDLVDQLFNSCERRLACVLLLLARYGLQEPPERTVPMPSPSTLAEMVGTTAARIDALLSKFRSSGFISYGDVPGLTIDRSLLDVVLEDPQPGPSPTNADHSVQK